MRFSTQSLTFFSTTLLLVFPSFTLASAPDAIRHSARDVLPAHRMVRKRAFAPAHAFAPMPAVMLNRRAVESTTDQNNAGGGLLGALLGGGGDKNTGGTSDGTTTNTTDPSTGDTTGTPNTADPGSTNTTDTSGTAAPGNGNTNGGSNNNPNPPSNPNNGGSIVSVSVAVQPSPSPSVAAPSSTVASATSTAVSSPTSATTTLNMSFMPMPTVDSDPFPTQSAATEGSTAGVNSDNSISPAQQNKSAFSHTTIIILIVVASSVVAAAIIWTAIRKWKFSPSRQFEDRLQRIDWQPSVGHETALSAGLGGGFRHGSTRDMSERPTSHGSFGSTDRARLDIPATTGNNASVAPDLPPAHDFTAGVAAPGGYADLSRGPTLNRGASLNRAGTLARGPSYGRARYGGAAGGYGGATQTNYGYGY